MTGWNGTGQVIRGDGSHSGSNTWQQAQDDGDDVEAGPHDTHDQILADAIENCIARDGQNSPTANINMANFKLTSLASGTGRSDSARIGDIQDGAKLWGGTTAGTANAQTVSFSPAITALVAGMTLRVIVGIDNTDALTLAVNGLPAVDVLTRGASALRAGEWVAGSIEELVYSGSTFRLLRPLYRRRFVIASEDYTVLNGLRSLRTRGVGAGGGGGGAGASNCAGGGGGAGEFVDHLFTKAALGGTGAVISVTIGALGSAGSSAGGNGGTGGNTSFGGFWTANGGAGGTGMASSSANAQAAGGAGGTAGTGSADFRIDGGTGNVGRLDGSGWPGAANLGGLPAWEFAAPGAIGTNGTFASRGYGAGGAGGNRTSGAGTGQPGRPGAIELIEEF